MSDESISRRSLAFLLREASDMVFEKRVQTEFDNKDDCVRFSDLQELLEALVEKLS